MNIAQLKVTHLTLGALETVAAAVGGRVVLDHGGGVVASSQTEAGAGVYVDSVLVIALCGMSAGVFAELWTAGCPGHDYGWLTGME